jgi:hypothetical protein
VEIDGAQTDSRYVTCITDNQTGISVTPHDEPEDANLRDGARRLSVPIIFAYCALGFQTARS